MRCAAVQLREPIIPNILRKDLEKESRKKSRARSPALKEKKSRARSPALKIVSTLFPRKDWI
jgi:hypothetical protein